MNEKIKGALEKVKAFFGKMSKRTRVLLGVGLSAVVVAAVVIAVVLNNKPYAVLFTGLSSDEASAVLTYMSENGYSDYQMQGSDTILVPEAQESLLKAKLLMEGYPTSGFNYSTYFDHVGSLSTESERNTAYLFDLQDRMSAVICCFDGVKSAVVNIAQGEDRRYVLDSSNIVAASASVHVTMEAARTLTGQQATAIRNLVARAVQGLEIDNISITDSLGNTYNSGDSAGSEEASQLKLRLEEEVNNSVRTNVMGVLIPIFGEDNVRVSVNSTVDVSRTTGDSVTYTEPEWAADGSTNGEGIIGSKVYDYEIARNGTTTVGGVVGTESNSDISTYVEEQLRPDGNETGISVSGQTDYNVDTNREQTVRTAGVVTDLMVSVTINSTTAGNVDSRGLITHVARAAGINETDQTSKISILSLPFYVTAPDINNIINNSQLPSWAIYAAIGGVVLLLLILVLSLIFGKKKKKRKVAEAEAAASELEAMLMQQQVEENAARPSMDVMNLKSERSMELRKDIRKFAEDSPEIAAQMIRTWLKGEESDA